MTVETTTLEDEEEEKAPIQEDNSFAEALFKLRAEVESLI